MENSRDEWRNREHSPRESLNTQHSPKESEIRKKPIWYMADCVIEVIKSGEVRQGLVQKIKRAMQRLPDTEQEVIRGQWLTTVISEAVKLKPPKEVIARQLMMAIGNKLELEEHHWIELEKAKWFYTCDKGDRRVPRPQFLVRQLFSKRRASSAAATSRIKDSESEQVSKRVTAQEMSSNLSPTSCRSVKVAGRL